MTTMKMQHVDMHNANDDTDKRSTDGAKRAMGTSDTMGCHSCVLGAWHRVCSFVHSCVKQMIHDVMTTPTEEVVWLGPDTRQEQRD